MNRSERALVWFAAWVKARDNNSTWLIVALTVVTDLVWLALFSPTGVLWAMACTTLGWCVAVYWAEKWGDSLRYQNLARVRYPGGLVTSSLSIGAKMPGPDEVETTTTTETTTTSASDDDSGSDGDSAE